MLSVLSTLSWSFHALLTSSTFCRRLLFLLHSSLPSPSPTPLSAFTDLSRWEDFPSHYALLRALHRYAHLLGHWRSSAAYLGQMLCFELDVKARQIYGMEVGLEGAGNRAVVEIDLLEEEAPRAFYLEYRPTSPLSSTTCIRHPAELTFLRTHSQRQSFDASSLRSSGRRSMGEVSSSLRSSLSSFFSSSSSPSSSSSSLFGSTPQVDAFTPPAVSSSLTVPFSSFSLSCPSLPNSAYIALGLQNLPTPLQRRQQALFYPNPPSTFVRLPPPSSLHFRPPSPYPPPGLYVGQYGPHGQELMHIDYGEAELVATKVFGDANVPAGKISFRVQLPAGVTDTTEERAKRRWKTEGKRRRSRAERAQQSDRLDGKEDPASSDAALGGPHAQSLYVDRSPASKRSHRRRSGPSSSTVFEDSATSSSNASTASILASLRSTRLLPPSSSTSPLPPFDPPSPLSEQPSVEVSDEEAASSHDEQPPAEEGGEEEDAEEEEEEDESGVDVVDASADRFDSASASSGSEAMSSAAMEDDEAEGEGDGDLVSRFLHFRRHLPPTLPSLPSLVSHPGAGTIALTGFNSPQSVDVVCHFHAGARFTLDFLGLISFDPFTCPCQELGHVDKRVGEAATGEAQRRSDRRRGSGERRQAGGCTRHSMR